MTAALVLASVALAVALTTAAAVIVLMRQNAETTSDLRRHRRAHTEAFGYPDPRLDRRQVNIGAPRATGERRGTRRYEPPPERLAPRDLVTATTPDGRTDVVDDRPRDELDVVAMQRADSERHLPPVLLSDGRTVGGAGFPDDDEMCGEPHPGDPDRRCVLPAGHDGLHKLAEPIDPDGAVTGELDRTDLPTTAMHAVDAPQRPRPRPREDTPT